MSGRDDLRVSEMKGLKDWTKQSKDIRNERVK